VKKFPYFLTSLVIVVPSLFYIYPAKAVPLSNPTATCSASCTIDFSYQSANYYAWTAPVTGTYTFQAWGAQGGGGGNYFGAGGAGGYAKGDATITAGTVIYIYVGQQGLHSSTTSLTAYNGGGAGNPASPDANSGYSGGGATHAAKDVGLLSTLSAKQSGILIVAGGGGGGAGSTTYYGTGYDVTGGAGGGLTGGTPVDSNAASIRSKGLPGSQSAGGLSATYNGSATESPYIAAAFGLGASSSASTVDNIQGGGGGGGFYGGGAGSLYGGAGAGGSGFVGNLTQQQSRLEAVHLFNRTDLHQRDVREMGT
jgi:Glycine rich protein